MTPNSSNAGPRGAGDHGPWTEDRIARLKALWGDSGLTAAIGQRLGVSRNAVLGKVNRLGLSNRRPAHGAKSQRLPATRPARAPSRASRPSADGPRGPRRDPARAAVADIGPGLVIHLEDLPPGACHFPIGDPAGEGFAFCGRRAGAPPYCEAHRSVAYRPRVARGGGRPAQG